MKWDMILRAVGVLGIVAAYGVFVFGPAVSRMPLVLTVLAIVSLIAPDVLDRLPWGPNT